MKIALGLGSLGLLGLFACCGDNHHNHSDAHELDGAVIDAPVDAFVECNYTEAHDTTNDYLEDPTAIEETNIDFAPGDTRTICGTINNGHYDAAFGSVDIDNYGVTLTHDADVLVRLTGSAQNISSVGIFAVTDTGGAAGGGYYLGNHAVFSQHLAAGHYQFSVEAYDDHDATAPVPYKARITTDNPEMRCPDLTAAANYTEAGDGATNDGNDIVAIDYSATQSFVLTGAADVPEPTNLILGVTNYRITGTSASVSGQGSYYDRDDYLITTGATTNELAIRLKPGSAVADMDYYLFAENRVNALGNSSATIGLGKEEFATFAVNPNTRYWLWAGKLIGTGSDASTNTTSIYDFSICGAAQP
jgi:hypothetical protein